MNRPVRVPLATAVQRRWPDLDRRAAEAAITSGAVVVDGRPVNNPGSLVAPDAAIRMAKPTDLRGRQKLAWAIDHFGAAVSGRVAIDVGAATGGFTTALLDAGAARVYAVDVGHGQLLGSLRQDPRVVNLERTNVAALERAVIAEPIGAVSIDVSYLALSAAAAQLNGLEFAAGAELLGLVKPMFELRLATIPSAPESLALALDLARQGISDAGWTVLASAESPLRGSRGAIEHFVHARR